MNPIHPMPSFVMNNGHYIPAIGLGTWLAENHLVGQAVLSALHNGYRHIDCAACYGNEEEIGTEAFEPFFKEGKVLRSEVFVTTKLWVDSKEKQNVRKACEESLRKLKLDYVDLYLIHYPTSIKLGKQFPLKKEDFIDVSIEETWREMEKLVEDGLVKSIGVSNFNIKQLEELMKIAKIKPVVNQVEFGIYIQQPKLHEFCREHHIHTTAYSPLGNNGNPDRNKIESVFENTVVKSLSEKYKKTVAQIILRFVVQKGHSVLAKSVKEERIIENCGIFDWSISEEDMKLLETQDRYVRTCHGVWFYGPLGLDEDTYWGADQLK